MEMVDTKRELDGVNIEKQTNIELYPFIETVLIGNSKVEVETLNQELASVRERQEAVQAENEKLKVSEPVAEFELPEAAGLYNQLIAKRKKTTVSLADIEAILEILEELTPLGGN